jgi:two-component system, NtrC family, response regulator AtoC
MNETIRVLVIDDDAAFRFAMVKALSRRGFAASEAASGEAALRVLCGSSPPDAALLDLRMGGIDGLEVLRRCSHTSTRIVVLTGHGTVDAAVTAMKLGAFSFLEKPLDADVLGPLLAQAAAETRKPSGEQMPEAPAIIGESRAINEVRSFIARVGQSDVPVALYGETGTGKEVVARHLHLQSRRARGPFVALNAACVQRELFESELFGHRKGAFTGATSDHVGMFGEANGGSLFIDEVGELPPETQGKLLRALETGTIRPVGAARELAVDVRIIAATNRDLWAEVRRGSFREDLYFRLQVLPLVLPPLRERREDIIPLAYHLLQRIGSELRIERQAETLLVGYDWPGNVRELLNVLRRATLFADGPEIDASLMRRMLAASVFGHLGSPYTQPGAPPPGSSASALEPPVTLSELERAHIQRVLLQMEGNITRAASALGIDRRTLQRKLRGFGLPSDD